MIDLDLEFNKHVESIKNIDLDSHTLKSVFSSISDDVKLLLLEADPEMQLNPNPNLVILSLVSLDDDNPCGVCREAYDQLLQFGVESGYIGDGKVRVLIVTEPDDKKIWNKLKITIDDSPRHYIFDRNFNLYDVVDGVMRPTYIETFYGKLIND